MESSGEEERLRDAPLLGSVRGQRAVRGKRFCPYSHRKAPGHLPIDTKHLGVERQRRRNEHLLRRESAAQGGYAADSNDSLGTTDRLCGGVTLDPGWDQARERRYQTIRALRLLMEVHDRSNEYLSRLATRSAPLSQGDNRQIMGWLFLTAEEVPPLVTDEDDGLTDWDAEGDMDKGED